LHAIKHIYKQDWQWVSQFLLPLSGGWMEARVLGCPGRPMAMLALSDARRVARALVSWYHLL